MIRNSRFNRRSARRLPCDNNIIAHIILIVSAVLKYMRYYLVFDTDYLVSDVTRNNYYKFKK